MSKVFNMVGGGGGPAASIFVTGLSETDTVTATKGTKTLTGKWTQRPNPASHGLPDGYTELEYIKGTGTQYIDTGILPNTDTKIAMSFSGLSGQLLFDSGGSGINRPAFSGWLQSTDNDYTTFLATDNYPYNGSVTYKFGSGKYDIEFSAGLLVVNGESFEFEKRSFSMSTTLAIFKDKDTGSVGSYMLEAFKHYNGENLVNDYVPCKRNSDGAIGMYDLCGSASPFDGTPFYGNAGTGEFVAGPEVPQTIDGHIISKIRDFGTWTVTATDGVQTATQDVLVDVITEYEIDMSLAT